MIKHKLLHCLLVFSIMFLTACSSNSIKYYANNTPKIQVETFFDGKLKAYGIVKDFRGRVIRHFEADIVASWENHVGTLNEIFYFNDGEVQKRTWVLKREDDNRYIATANDVIGKHTMLIAGNAIFMNYVLSIDYKGKPLHVSVDDKMFLVDEKHIINESVLKKWGLPVAAIQLTIEKL